ncbi:hypothetical protein [Brucella endophytica]|uniref:hypothetical protein n=1 Tax=Brucella endophytica TaxID=1963359 RepID=UPI0016694649|nr:hypothetical protein [Brucella endophytica]
MEPENGKNITGLKREWFSKPAKYWNLNRINSFVLAKNRPIPIMVAAGRKKLSWLIKQK